MSTRATEPGEEQVAFLQQRVGLFSQVMFAISVLGGCVHVAFTDHEQLLQPWFAVYVAYGLLVMASWLLCRTGARSVRFIRGLEASILIVVALAASIMIRFQLVPRLPPIVGDVVGVGDPGYDRIVGLLVVEMSMALMLGLVLMVVARAAIVPSRRRRTVVLTVLVGVVAGTVTTFGAIPLEDPALILDHTPRFFTITNALNFAVWWTMTTFICVVVSQVIYGLREEVRHARQLGQYTLQEKLGEGGMGVVYRACHAMMRRPTAVKLLSPEKAGEANLARFEREVQLTSRLTHPNTITVFDYGRTPDGVFYYAMELLDGATIEDVVRVDGAQPPGRVLKVLAEVASALEEAHGIDFIHRDIKPANIILCRQGGKPDVAKLVDFGLVKDLADTGDLAVTNAGSITGTPYYMSPESLTNPEMVDGRSDIYSLGAVGYYLLTGGHVFQADSLVEVCSHHLHTEPVPPSQRSGEAVPEDLEVLLLACLAKNPGDRPQSATELLERVLACGAMGEWDEAKARDWWREHQGELRAPPSDLVDVGTDRTVAVDLGHRAPA